MKSEEPFILTISRMKGSGGTYIGRQIAHELNIPYIDRFNIRLNECVYCLDDGPSNFIDSDFYVPANGSVICDVRSNPIETKSIDEDFHNTDVRIIREIARTTTAVVVGCGADYILQDDVRCLNVFLYSDMEARVDRVRLEQNITTEQARKIVLSSDNNRRQFYYNQFGIYWPDVNQYDLSINTNGMKLETVVDVVVVALIEKFKIDRAVPLYHD